MIKIVGVRFKKAGKIYYFDPAGLDIEVNQDVIVETARGLEFGHVVVGKIYYFDPAGLDIEVNQDVIVETARGLEFGHVVVGGKEIAEEELVSPLKPIIRIATEEDKKIYDENKEKAKDTFVLCQEKIGGKEIAEEELVSPLKPIIRIATEEDKKIYDENKEKAKDTFVLCQEKIKEHGLTMCLIDCEYTFDRNKLIFYFTAEGRIDFRELVKDLASIFKTRIELRQILESL